MPALTSAHLWKKTGPRNVACGRRAIPYGSNYQSFLTPPAPCGHTHCQKKIGNVRHFSNQSSNLEFEEYGDPGKVVKMKTENISDIKPNQILIKLLAATVNPADINTIQGMYAIKPQLPCIGGNEGVAQIVQVGENVEGFASGDWVIPRYNAFGTWRSYAIADPDEFMKIPSDLSLALAATIAVNPGTAYRMLHDFVELKEGDTVIQNGSNSAVGQAVIQIAKSMGVKTINIVRDRPNIDELKSNLMSIGATVVETEEDLKNSKAVSSLPKPSLAFNCVSGRSGANILRQLSPSGVMVTYGGMSRKPVTVPVGSLIFTDVTLQGFWMTRWNNKHSHHPARQEMLEKLFSLARNGQLRAPEHDLVSFTNFQSALERAMPAQGMHGKKQILIFDF
ncbi:unnamed protein product, partial [Meganyctiphanes norvegica]